MKYLVNISYTNPAHEHVSLRRRVDTINRVVEARSEEEALNRVANQQRALGFLVRDAKVIEEAVSFGRSGGVMHYDPKTEKSEKPAKGVSALDKDGNLVGHYKDLETAKKNKPGHTYQTSKGVAKEEVELDEAQKKLKPSYWRAEWRMGTKSDVDKNNKKIYDKLIKTDPEKAAKFHDSLMKMRKEEVEQVEEGAKETAMRAFSLADKMRKKNPAQAKIYQKLGQKASLRMNNPTGVSTGKPSGSGNKAQRRMGVEPVPSAMSSDRMRGYFEEVEQTDEALLPKQQAVADKLKASELAANKEKAGYKFGKSLRAAKVAAKMQKEETEVQYIEEKLTAADPASEWIKDFVASDNPKFAGKSKKERINMALGAYYAAKRSKNEATEKKYNEKEVKHDEKKQEKKKGSLNKVKMEPEIEISSQGVK